MENSQTYPSGFILVCGAGRFKLVLFRFVNEAKQELETSYVLNSFFRTGEEENSRMKNQVKILCIQQPPLGTSGKKALIVLK